jgi:hypothetical protein
MAINTMVENLTRTMFYPLRLKSYPPLFQNSADAFIKTAKLPQKINLIWDGGDMPLHYLQHITRISRGAQKATKTNAEPPKILLWVKDKAKFESHYLKNRISSCSAGDVELLPEQHGIEIHEFQEIPEKTPIDKLLGHVQRTDGLISGRNKAITAADIAKVRVTDHSGGMVIDIRSALPKPDAVFKPIKFNEYTDIQNQSKAYLSLPSKAIEFFPVPKTYKPLPDCEYDLVANHNQFTADYMAARPNTQATKTMKQELAKSILRSCNQKMENLAGFLFYCWKTQECRGLFKFFSGRTGENVPHPLKVLHDKFPIQPFESKQSQIFSCYDLERAPHQGTKLPSFKPYDLPPEFLNEGHIGARTGYIIKDISGFYPGRTRVSNAAEHIKSTVLSSTGGSKPIGEWKTKLPTARAQDDLDI